MFGLPVWCYLFFLPSAFFILLAVFEGIRGIVELDAVRKGRAVENLVWGIGIGILTLGGLFLLSHLFWR